MKIFLTWLVKFKIQEINILYNDGILNYEEFK